MSRIAQQVRQKAEQESGGQYTWRGRNRGVAAETVASVVNRIIAEEGSCPPKRLVDEARPEDSPLHRLFDWNDETAAEAHRRNQARQIIRSVEIRIVEGVNEISTSAFISVGRVEGTKHMGSGYRRMEDVFSNEATRKEALDAAAASLRAWRIRYQNLTELAELFEAVDQQLAQLKLLDTGD